MFLKQLPQNTSFPINWCSRWWLLDRSLFTCKVKLIAKSCTLDYGNDAFNKSLWYCVWKASNVEILVFSAVLLSSLLCCVTVFSSLLCYCLLFSAVLLSSLLCCVTIAFVCIVLLIYIYNRLVTVSVFYFLMTNIAFLGELWLLARKQSSIKLQ